VPSLQDSGIFPQILPGTSVPGFRIPPLRGWISDGSTRRSVRNSYALLSAQACDQGFNDRRDQEDEYEVGGGAAGGIIFFQFRHGSSLEFRFVRSSGSHQPSPDSSKAFASVVRLRFL